MHNRTLLLQLVLLAVIVAVVVGWCVYLIISLVP